MKLINEEFRKQLVGILSNYYALERLNVEANFAGSPAGKEQAKYIKEKANNMEITAGLLDRLNSEKEMDGLMIEFLAQLLDQGEKYRNTGRTAVLAKTYLRLAVLNTDKPIKPIDHNPAKDANRHLVIIMERIVKEGNYDYEDWEFKKTTVVYKPKPKQKEEPAK